MQSRLYHAGWKLLDLLFPPSCAGCGSWGDRYCPTCFENTKLILNPICQICGDRLYHGKDVVCDRCRNQAVAFTAIRSWAEYSDPLQSAIHRLKYRNDRGLAEVLSQPMVNQLDRYHWLIDLILPVPLDEARRKARGYNQAALLARPISWRTGIPISENSLFRSRRTRPQVGLSISDRTENVAGAFKAESKSISEKKLLIVDDVITTGATINACAQALIKAGAAQVFGLTLARSSLL